MPGTRDLASCPYRECAGCRQPAEVAAFDAGYARLAAALRETAPDVCLIVSAEHVNKFFIDNMPAFCMGLFDSFAGPVEGRTRDVGYPWREVPSDPELARYLIERGLDEGVDWAVSEFWEVDHGMMVPLHKLDPDGRVPMIPVFVNCASAPMPSARRCFAVGRWLSEAIADWPASKRVGILATGGLSHSVGTLTRAASMPASTNGSSTGCAPETVPRSPGWAMPR